MHFLTSYKTCFHIPNIAFEYAKVQYRVRFEVLTAVTMKNAVFWDIRAQFVPHRGPLHLRYKAQQVSAM
jgi:hypothetical protein